MFISLLSSNHVFTVLIFKMRELKVREVINKVASLPASDVTWSTYSVLYCLLPHLWASQVALVVILAQAHSESTQFPWVS